MSSLDRALRSLVVDLAVLRAEDATAVLDQLSLTQRKKVEALLAQVSEFGFGKGISVSADGPSSVDASRVSAWLLERMGSGRVEIKMTAQAHATLRDCAVRLYPLPRSCPSPRARFSFDAVRRFKSLFGAGQPA